MPDDKSISELITAEQQSGGDLFEIAIPNALSDTGYLSRKVSATELANLLLKQLLYTSDLTTTAKTIIAAINEAAASGGGASANEALPYDATDNYSYGDYCIQNNYLWRCTSANGATGTWDATKWVAVLVTDEYKRVRIMNKADFDLLSADEKDGFIYVSDYPTKIQDIDNVTLTTSDNNKILGVIVSGNDINVGAVEIPNLNNTAWQTATRNDAGGFTGGQCRYIKCGKLVLGVIEDLIGVNSTHNTVVFSNLPIPASGMIGLIQLTGAVFKAPFRVRIGSGNIVNWYSSINNVQGSEGYMFFAYVSE